MCTNPGMLPNGQTFACRKCGQCIGLYVDDWVGRCVAESKTAVGVNVVSLTYGDRMWVDGRDVPVDQKASAAMLTYSDVQKWVKRLRSRGFPMKYFCVGEYGDKKGRAHWHVICFWEKAVPEVELRTDYYHHDSWPHGTSYWDSVVPELGEDYSVALERCVRYACKYLGKHILDKRSQTLLRMSKKPPLGSEYFELMAQKYVDDFLAPQSPYYSFAGVVKPSGAPKLFQLTRASLDAFLAAYVRRWKETHGNRLMPRSDMVDEYLDGLSPALPFRPVPYSHPAERPWFTPDWNEPGDSGILFDDRRNAWFVVRSGRTLFWSWNDEGRRAWLDVIRTEPAESKEFRLSRESGFNEYSARKDGTLYASRRGQMPNGKR